MSKFANEVSGSEASGDIGAASDVSEADRGYEVNENEMDEDLSRELDDFYDLYIEENAEKFLEDDFNENDEVNETDESPPDDIWSDIDRKYNSYIEDKNFSSVENEKVSEDDSHCSDCIENGEQQTDNAESLPEHIKCRNENLEGQKHPETGVPFERRQIEVDGIQYEVVVPKFESFYDAQLPENMYEATDHTQFKECDLQLKNEVAANKELRERFDDEQLKQIEDGETPDGYTWHHDAEAGKMQLVDAEAHQQTAHTGGRNIWGGGTDRR